MEKNHMGRLFLGSSSTLLELRGCSHRKRGGANAFYRNLARCLRGLLLSEVVVLRKGIRAVLSLTAATSRGPNFNPIGRIED